MPSYAEYDPVTRKLVGISQTKSAHSIELTDEQLTTIANNPSLMFDYRVEGSDDDLSLHRNSNTAVKTSLMRPAVLMKASTLTGEADADIVFESVDENSVRLVTKPANSKVLLVKGQWGEEVAIGRVCRKDLFVYLTNSQLERPTHSFK